MRIGLAIEAKKKKKKKIPHVYEWIGSMCKVQFYVNNRSE